MAERRSPCVQLLADFLELLFTDVIRVLVARHLIRQIALEWQGFLVNILPPGKDTGCNSAVMRRRNHPQVVSFTGGKHGVPEVFGVFGGFFEVDFVALLTGKTGLGDNHVMAGHLALHQAIVRNILHSLTEQVSHERLRSGALDLHRRYIDFRDGDVEAHPDVDAPQPEFQVAIGKGEPELVLGNTKQNRVIQNTTLFIAQNDVLATHGFYLGGIASDHIVHEAFRIRALDLNLAFYGHVPHGDVMNQRLVFHHGAAIFRTDITPRVIHSVVNGCPPASGFVRQVPIRRLAHTGGDQHLHRRWAGLAQVDGNPTIGLINTVRLAGGARPLLRIIQKCLLKFNGHCYLPLPGCR